MMEITAKRTEVVKYIYTYTINGVEITDKYGDLKGLLYDLCDVGGFLDAIVIDDNQLGIALEAANLVKRCGPNGIHFYGSDFLKNNLQTIVEKMMEAQENIDKES